MESKVNFWTKVYSEYTTDQVIIHDLDNLDVIYEVVDFTGQKHLSRRAKNKKIKKVKNAYRKILRKLASKKKNAKMNEREKQIYNLIKKSFRNASNNIRGQLGQKDRFRQGLQKSGYYMDEMRKIFREFGLPEELTALPHVESSFNTAAYSKSGAAGIWQFMRPTGKRFMKINYAIDERRDPIFATIAAAKLLKGNYEELGNWPLAITAYNHGLNGMKRAKKKLGSDDIVDVINGYKSRRFGFASENFYAQFLAALEVSKNHKKIFPGLKFYKPKKYDSFKLPKFVSIETLSKNFNMSVKDISVYNPSLRPPVLRSEQYVPKGLVLHVPKNRIANLRMAYSNIPEKEKYNAQKRTKWYKVHRGDTLGKIARRFRTRIKVLRDINQISRSGMIYAGQVLQLPGSSRIKTASLSSRKSLRKYKEEKKLFSGKHKKVVIRKRDTLESISKKHKVSIKAIMRENSLKNPNRIYVGQVLNVPILLDRKERIKLAKLDIPPAATKPEDLENSSLNKIELVDVNVELSTYDKKIATNHLQPVSVKKDPKKKYMVGYILAEVDETIGHYAEWSGVSANFIRKTNGFKYGRYIHLNQKIKVPFLRVTPDVFFQRRSEFHKSIQEDFFENYKVKKTIKHQVKAGVTVWEICNETYDIPLWLLKRFNPKTDLENLKRGEELIIPIVSQIQSVKNS